MMTRMAGGPGANTRSEPPARPRQVRIGAAIFGPRPGPPFDWAAAAADADAESAGPPEPGGGGGVLLAGR
jgi:hypothetical protein